VFRSFFLIRKYYKKHNKHNLPFCPTQDERIKVMLELSDPKLPDKMIDLGAGNGKIVIAFANIGIESYGIEIDENLTELAKLNIRKKHLEKTAYIIHGDFWKENLSPYNIITIYGLNNMMYRLKYKIDEECRKGCRILCNYCRFPDWPIKKELNNVALYIK
jgi:SAM-dependent methyltransferase